MGSTTERKSVLLIGVAIIQISLRNSVNGSFILGFVEAHSGNNIGISKSIVGVMGKSSNLELSGSGLHS